MLVKICGTTTVHDARLAAEAGADFLGVILQHTPSPRNISLETACEIGEATSTPLVAVTVNLQLPELLHIHSVLAPAVLQLHGDEPVELVQELVQRGLRVWAAVGGEHAAQRASTLADDGVEAILVDSRDQSSSGTIYGGTGKRSDWELARSFSDSGTSIVLSGGLSPANVVEAMAAVQPFVVDVVSGVEVAPGRKDPEKLKQFVKLAKEPGSR